MRFTIGLVSALGLLGSTAQAAPIGAEARMVATVDAEQVRTLKFLETMVNQNSGSRNLEGVRKVRDLVVPDALGAQLERVLGLRRVAKAQGRSVLVEGMSARLRERLETLSPAERKALVGQTRERWQALSPEERQDLAEQRRARIQAMTPQERRQLLDQRRDMLSRLSPEERAALREKLPTR